MKTTILLIGIKKNADMKEINKRLVKSKAIFRKNFNIFQITCFVKL